MDIPLPEATLAKLNFSKGAFGFEEVLESFAEATSVVVVTYHLDLKHGAKLLERLKKLPTGVRVTLVSSVPSRWEHYHSVESATRAKLTIEQYLAALDPEKFNCSLEPWFCFQNHAKIVATDSVAYIGSQNFADTSKENFECGVILRGPETMASIVDPIVEKLLTESERYLGHLRGRFLILIRSAGLATKNFLNQAEEWKAPVTTYGGDEEWELDPSLAARNPILPDSLTVLTEEVEALLDELSAFDELAPALEEFSHNALQTIADLGSSDELERFATYEPDKFVADKLAVAPPPPDDMDSWHAETVEDEIENQRKIENDVLPILRRLEGLFRDLTDSLRELYRAVKDIPPGSAIDNTSSFKPDLGSVSHPHPQKS